MSHPADPIAESWPLFGLRISTSRLVLRLPREGEPSDLALAARDLAGPDQARLQKPHRSARPGPTGTGTLTAALPDALDTDPADALRICRAVLRNVATTWNIAASLAATLRKSAGRGPAAGSLIPSAGRRSCGYPDAPVNSGPQ